MSTHTTTAHPTTQAEARAKREEAFAAGHELAVLAFEACRGDEQDQRFCYGEVYQEAANDAEDEYDEDMARINAANA